MSSAGSDVDASAAAQVPQLGGARPGDNRETQPEASAAARQRTGHPLEAAVGGRLASNVDHDHVADALTVEVAAEALGEVGAVDEQTLLLERGLLIPRVDNERCSGCGRGAHEAPAPTRSVSCARLILPPLQISATRLPSS